MCCLYWLLYWIETYIARNHYRTCLMEIKGKEIISCAHNIKRYMHTSLTHFRSVNCLKVSVIQVELKVIYTFFQTLQIYFKGF